MWTRNCFQIQFIKDSLANKKHLHSLPPRLHSMPLYPTKARRQLRICLNFRTNTCMIKELRVSSILPSVSQHIHSFVLESLWGMMLRSLGSDPQVFYREECCLIFYCLIAFFNILPVAFDDVFLILLVLFSCAVVPGLFFFHHYERPCFIQTKHEDFDNINCFLISSAWLHTSQEEGYYRSTFYL